MKTKVLFFMAGLFFTCTAFSQSTFNGLDMNMGNLFMLSDAKTFSISPENFTGEKGKGGMARLEDADTPNAANAHSAARDMGQGWKLNPFVLIPSGETFTLAEIDGAGAIQHVWMTPSGNWRYSIIRIYWDDEKEPSVECPVGSFFGMGWNKFAPINSLAVCVNPGSAFNCYWVMPFRKKCRITMENIGENQMSLYYQVDYTLTDVPDDAAYFHAQFRRSNPTIPMKDHVLLDKIKGKGHYVGTYVAWQSNSSGWWGEGEIKFFIDGDKEFPTICGTGTEDYFCGSYGFISKDNEGKQKYDDYSTAYAGFHAFTPEDNAINRSQTRFGMYRWHIVDPVRFDSDLKITIQALGWRSGRRYLPLKDDISSVAYWYQAEPHGKFPQFPGKDELEVN